MTIRRTNPTVLLVLIPLLAAAGGCVQIDRGLEVGNPAAVQKKGRPVFGDPIALPGTPKLLVPFAVESAEPGKAWEVSSLSMVVIGSSAWEMGSTTGGYSGGTSMRWNNVAFYDPGTGDARLLLDRPAVISRFHARGEKSPVRGDYLLFGVSDRDTDGDGLINADDAVRLLRTDASGENVNAVTAIDTQVLDVTSLDERRLYLRVRRDTDGNGKFNAKDLIDVMWVDVTTWAEPRPVISEDLRRAAFDAAGARAAAPR